MLKKGLGKHSKSVKHHAALAYADLPDFLDALKAKSGAAARALEFTIFTAARTSETIGARWSEIDLDKKLWIIPAERMKAAREHRVPLSDQAIEIIHEMQKSRGEGDAFVFPGQYSGSSLSNMAMIAALKRMKRQDITPHGFRSTFRDWAAEETNVQNHVVEMALAHTISSEVERAYRRGDLLEKRRPLMNAWGSFCMGATMPANVLPLHGRAAP